MRPSSGRRLFGAALLASIAVGPALACAQTPQFERAVDIEIYQPTAATHTLLSIEEPQVAEHLTFSFGLAASGALNPLVRTVGSVEQPIVSRRIEADLLVSFGLLQIFEIGLALPLIQQEVADDVFASPLTYADRVSLGDLRLSLKMQILRSPLGVALRLVSALPTGDSRNFAGVKNWVFSPEVVVARQVGPVLIVADVGYRFRRRTFVAPSLELDDELVLSLGARWRVAPSFDVLAELNGRVGVGASEMRASQFPIELLAGPRLWIGRALSLHAAVGLGVKGGYGAPDVRAVLGARYATERNPCVAGPEDFDGFEDGDFCADPDNDRDRIADADDACPNDAEDRDGFADADGCPDSDDDADGIADGADRCPRAPEDRDGFDDADGCPDEDNDQDGVADVRDDCPMDPEDRDNFQDDDGCPEPGPNAAVVTVTDTRILISETIYFDYDQDTIRPVSLPMLNQVADVIRRSSQIRQVRIEGHTDAAGDADYNLDLSYRRARAVMEYLVGRGVDRHRLTYMGYGSARPVADNRAPDLEMVQQVVEVQHPVAEGHPGRILRALRARMSPRLPEDQAVAGRQRPHIGLPHARIAADAVGQHHGQSRALVFVVDPDAVAGLEVAHARLPPFS